MTNKNQRMVILRILALLFVIGLTVLIYLGRNEIGKFKSWGYPGIFLITLLANSTVLLPAPGIAFVFTMGNVLNPFGVALAASVGGTLGEMSGYLTGFSGQAIIEKVNIYKKIEPFVIKYGGFAVMLFAAIPNPFFDLAGIAAGGLKMPVARFLLFCWIGQLFKMLMFSFAGFYSIHWIFGN
jgi:membrane protein DedA with SNARE-associated domain